MNTEEILRKRFPNAKYISEWHDPVRGIDFGVGVGSRQYNIHVEKGEPGISKLWHPTNQKDSDGNILSEPELVLEVWEDHDSREKGWVFNEKKEIDYVLFVFDPSDTPNAYVVPYIDIRETFKKHFNEWTAEFGLNEKVVDGRTVKTCSVPVGILYNAIIALEGENAEAAKRQELYGEIVRGGNK